MKNPIKLEMIEIKNKAKNAAFCADLARDLKS